MFSFVAHVALSALLATSAMAQTYQINTPLSVVVCQPALLSWTGGSPPFFLSNAYSPHPLEVNILPAGQPSAPALLDLGSQSGNSVTWVANLQPGISGFLNLRDSTGTLAQSGPFTVQSGTNTSCVGQTPVTSAGPGGAAGQAPASTSGSTSGTASATKSNTPSTTPSSAAIAQYAPAGVAAMVGAAMLALVA